MAWIHNIHPILGGLLFVMFAFQGITGGGSLDATEEDRQDKSQALLHRWNGRALVKLLPVVYAAGLLTVLLNGKDVVAHPPHLIAGTLLLATAAAAFLLARRFRKTGSKNTRNIHITLGASAIALYVVQAVIGLGILLGIRLT